MRYRQKLGPKKSKRLFRRSSGQAKLNRSKQTGRGIRRGGTRL